MVPYFPFLEAAYMARMCGGGTQDTRVAIIERARELGRVEFANNWDIRVKMSAELNGSYFVPKKNEATDHTIYSPVIFWSCYYKNGKFMFAFPYDNYTDRRDFYKNEDGSFYLKNEYTYSDFETIGIDYAKSDYDSFSCVQIIFSYSLKSTTTYYKSDGTIDSQKIFDLSDTSYMGSIGDFMYAQYNRTISRGDLQTYINDVMDFASTV